MPDGRQATQQAYNSAGRDRTRSNVKNIGAANIVWPHVADGNCSRRDRARRVFTEEFDRRN